MMALAVCALAFWMGYSVSQGGTCAVATAHEILHHRRPRMLLGLLAASAAAGLVAVPLTWFAAGWAGLAATVAVSWTLIAGAVVFGIGATINDACLLGSLGRLGEGEFRLAILPAGLAAGFSLVDATGLGDDRMLADSVLTRPGPLAYAVLAAFGTALPLVLSLVARGDGAPRQTDRWPLGVSMLVLGATGGSLYATAPGWTYADLVHRSLPLAMGLGNDTGALTVTATVVGSVSAALRRRRWRPRRITGPGVVRTLVGGCLMGMGAASIPGGNDGLILAAIPALSSGGATAFVVMLVTIMAILGIRHVLHGGRGDVRVGPS